MHNELIRPFDLDKALDTVDLTFNGYTPTEDALDFFNVLRLVQGEDFEFTTPLFHYWLVDLLFGNIKREHYPYSEEVRETITINPKRIAIVASRGVAKSTVVTAFYPVYCAVRGKTPDGVKSEFHVLVAASQQGGGRVMAKAVQSLCEDSVFCQNYFESMRFTETESEFIRKGPGKVKNRVFLARYVGIGGGIRGIRSNIGAERPDHIIFDDVILNSDTAYSTTIMNSLRNTINADAVNALKGGDIGKIFSVATPFHLQDPVVETLTMGAYTPVAIPICESIREDMTEDEFVGAWPSMHPFKSIMSQFLQAKASNSTRAFNQERMLRIASEEDRLIPDALIEEYSRVDLEKHLDEYNIFITTDFTTTSEAKSDFSGIAAWAVNSEGTYFMLDLCLKRQTIGEQYEELFRMAKYWGGKTQRAIEVSIETSGQQKAHVFAIKEMMVKRNQYFIIARGKGKPMGQEGIPISIASGGKHERFRLTLPLWQNRKIKFPVELRESPDMQEGMRQLRYTTYAGFGGHDDFLDLISIILQTEIYTPMKIFGEEERFLGFDADSMLGEGHRLRSDSAVDLLGSPYDSYAN